MKQAKVIQKLMTEVDQTQRKILKHGWNMDRLATLDISNVTDLRYSKRNNYFSATNVGFSPETMEGHSYDWYSLVRKFDNTVVLNAFRYSPTTSKHISKVRNVLRTLGVKYSELEAPKGLQNLESAKAHHLIELGKAIVEHRFARIKNDSGIKHHRKCLALLEKLGEKHAENDLADSIVAAEQDRNDRLSEQKKKRLEKKLESYLENDCFFRDYDIVDRSNFGDSSKAIACKVAVHQVVDVETLEHDVQNAIQNFSRDGFGSIVFYI